MHFNLAAFGLAASSAWFGLASATPITQRRSTAPDPNVWPVTGFTTGCSPAGCTFKFNVSRPASQYNPGFDTSCNGTDVNGGYQACLDQTVTANLIPDTYPKWGVEVKHKYPTDSEGGFAEAYANATVSSPTTNFTVNVYKFDGVN
jgi:hypothetical protein